MGLFKKSKEELHQKGMEYFSKKDYANAFKMYKEAAEMGLAPAMCNYAIFLENGLGCTADCKEAEKWYWRAAAAGSKLAFKNYREKYKDKDISSWLDLLVARGKNGDIESLLEAAEAYIAGEITEQDLDAADKLLDLVPEDIPDELAGEYCYITSLLFRSKGYGAKPESIIESLEAAMNNGDLRGALELAEIYCYGGHGIMPNAAKAKEILEETKERGDEEVAELIDELPEWYYCHGILKADDDKFEEAYALFKKGAEYGGPQCMKMLADFCADGTGCEKNEKLALSLYETAFNLGCSDAVRGLADCYDYGLGCEKDREKVKDVYKKAAEMGNTYGIIKYVPFIKDIKDPVERFSEAKKYQNAEYEKSVDNSLAELCGDMCRDGIGTEKDIEEAERWYLLARKRGANSEIFIKLGEMFNENKEYLRAWDWFETAVKYEKTEKKAREYMLSLREPVDFYLTPKRKEEIDRFLGL